MVFIGIKNMKIKLLKNKHRLLVFIKQIKDYIFPIYCLDCNKEGDWLCEDCYKKLDLSGRFFCPVCHLPTEYGECCANCLEQSFLDKEIAILKYSEQEIIGKIIHNLKYNYAEDLEDLIKKIIIEFCQKNSNLFTEATEIVLVPLHKKRYAERGFNQAEIIAESLAEILSLPINKNLKRIRYTKQQAKLNKKERAENINEAFALLGKNISSTIILVDDVFTTGSTMQACAKVLKEKGVKKVIGFTLARG